MKYFELELDGEIIKFRLTSEHSVIIEKKTQVKLLDYMQDYAITTIITFLTYMRRSDVPNFSEKDAYVLYDKLVDNGYTLERIMKEVIFEALVVSGFLSKEQLEEMMKQAEGKKQEALQK